MRNTHVALANYRCSTIHWLFFNARNTGNWATGLITWNSANRISASSSVKNGVPQLANPVLLAGITNQPPRFFTTDARGSPGNRTDVAPAAGSGLTLPGIRHVGSRTAWHDAPPPWFLSQKPTPPPWHEKNIREHPNWGAFYKIPSHYASKGEVTKSTGRLRNCHRPEEASRHDSETPFHVRSRTRSWTRKKDVGVGKRPQNKIKPERSLGFS